MLRPARLIFEQKFTMTDPSAIEIQLAKEMVPEFTVNSKDLPYFLKQAENLITLLKKNPPECLFNRVLFENVKAKITGEAREILISNDCDTFTNLKRALITRYGDPRSEELLSHDLNTCYQTQNEHFENYFEKIKQKLRAIVEHVNLQEENEAVKMSKILMYENQALATVKAGIQEPYCGHLLNTACDSIARCLYECRRLDNHNTQTSFMKFLRNREKPQSLQNLKRNTFNTLPQTNNYNKPFNRPPNARPFFQPNFMPTYPPRQSFPNYRPSSNNFPRGPVNITRQNNIQNQPTPMSISTANTYRNAPQNRNYFRQTGPPNFISEELTNMENEENVENAENFQEEALENCLT